MRLVAARAWGISGALAAGCARRAIFAIVVFFLELEAMHLRPLL